MKIPCVLIPAIVGIITAFLGYLAGKLHKNKEIEKTRKDLEAKLESCIYMQKTIREENEHLKGELAAAKESLATAELAAAKHKKISKVTSSSSRKPVAKDNLKIINGIGPKIEKLLQQNGISTWKELSEAPVEKLEQILELAGPSFMIHNHHKWAAQAKLALEGKLEELKKK